MPPGSSTIFPGQDARMMRYQDVLAKMSAKRPSPTNQLSGENNQNMSDGWNSEEDNAEEGMGRRIVKSEGVGPLLGGFADADDAEDVD